MLHIRINSINAEKGYIYMINNGANNDNIYEYDNAML